jgi:hypothetical protein
MNYIFWVCFCRLRYPTCNVHVPYCHLWPLQYFSTLPHKRHDFRKKLLNIECVSWLSLQVLSETFHILRTRRDMIKNVYWSSCKVPDTCPSLMKLEFSGQIFKKYPNIKRQENPSSGSRVVPYRKTDMSNLIVMFRNFVKESKNRVNEKCSD